MWTHLQEPITIEEIAEKVSKSFQGVTMAGALQDVNSVVQEMLSLDLVVIVK